MLHPVLVFVIAGVADAVAAAIPWLDADKWRQHVLAGSPETEQRSREADAQIGVALRVQKLDFVGLGVLNHESVMVECVGADIDAPVA